MQRQLGAHSLEAIIGGGAALVLQGSPRHSSQGSRLAADIAGLQQGHAGNRLSSLVETCMQWKKGETLGPS